MKRTHSQTVAELKRRLDDYVNHPEKYTEEDIQSLIRELDWAKHPEEPPAEPSPKREPDVSDGRESVDEPSPAANDGSAS